MVETDDLFQDKTTYKTKEIKLKDKEVDNMTKETSKRAKVYGNCLEDAIAAFQYADLKYDTEDVRQVATSFFIDEGRNSRTKTINAERKNTSNNTTTTTTTPAEGETDKINYLKIELDKDYPVTITKDLGEVEGKFGMQRKFGITLGDTYYYFTCSGKLAGVLKEGQEVMLRKTKDGKYTHYSAIENGKELINY